MLPLSDGIPARRFPIVNVLLIVANFAVFILYELPHFNTAVYHASFYPCSVDGACWAPEPWGLSWITAMFLHGGWFGLFSASANGGGVAFFAHVGGFTFGLLVARLLAWAGRAAPREQWRSTA
jgi:membrane associated rhomboid family serine protease